MVILLFGPPGSGKGTQSKRIVSWLEIPAISTGEMLRREVAQGSELGKEVESILAAGNLVSSDLVNRIVENRIAEPDCADGVLLDGYPRTIDQAEYLQDLLRRSGLEEPYVIHLEVPQREIIERTKARRQCPKCGRVYNLLNQPPLRRGVCDFDGEPLIERKDDDPAIVRERLEAYEHQTAPVLHFYENGNLHVIDGTLSPNQIYGLIERILEPAFEALQAKRAAKKRGEARSAGPINS